MKQGIYKNLELKHITYLLVCIHIYLYAYLYICKYIYSYIYIISDDEYVKESLPDETRYLHICMYMYV
jgi:hypothetical protein